MEKWCYIDGSNDDSPVALGFAIVPYEGQLPRGYTDLGEMSREEAINVAYALLAQAGTDGELLGTVHKPVDESYRL